AGGWGSLTRVRNRGRAPQPLLHDLGVVLAVPRARHEAGELEAVQQVVDAVERVAGAELGLEDLQRVDAAERADAPVGLGGAAQHAGAEGLLLVPRQLGRP